jgi:hypothetical protein
MLLLLISPVFPLCFYVPVPVGMTKTLTSPKEQAIAKVVRKLRESEQNEGIGSVLKESTVDNEDSGNRYPGWPGTSVFRMLLIPAHKVGAIIGHRGERVRRLCDETKACVRIIGGHLCATEHAVSCPFQQLSCNKYRISCYFVKDFLVFFIRSYVILSALIFELLLDKIVCLFFSCHPCMCFVHCCDSWFLVEQIILDFCSFVGFVKFDYQFITLDNL